LKGGYFLTKIFLDAGHGGYDFGAINVIREKDIVLTITLKIAEYLKAYKNVETMLTRNKDEFLTLTERTNRANTWGADAFVSVHINASTDLTVRGFETFAYTDAGASTIAFQNVMHEEIVNQISNYSGFKDRGKKRANFHVLRETNMKAILTENLFISNTADSTLLKSDEYLEKVALGHVHGLEKFFGLERIRPPSNNTGEKLYQVIAGTFENLDNAKNKVEELKKDGHDCYISEK
jgi:N-acetylmuramoyl-L-alanine amidase